MKQEGKFRYENIIYLLLLLQCCSFFFFTYSHKYTIQYKIFRRNTFCGLLRFAGFNSSTKYKNENQMIFKGTSIVCLFVFLMSWFVLNFFTSIWQKQYLFLLLSLYSSGHIEAPNDL